MKAHIIDGSGYVFRAYYALPPLTRSDGTPINAVYGYCQMLWELVRARDCTHMAVIMDGGRSGREIIDAGYKANRKPKPDELIAQLRMIEDATAAFGVATVKIAGKEADDVIATYAQQIAAGGGQATIYSQDKDLLPLLTHDGVGIYDPLKKQVVTSAVCADRLGVTPDQVRDYLALVGDASDNIPGVPGIGAKTAAQLLQVHGDLDAILALAASDPRLLSCKPAQQQKIADNTDAARVSRDLVTLQSVDDLPELDTIACRDPDHERLRAYLLKMEFNGLAGEIDQLYSVAA